MSVTLFRRNVQSINNRTREIDFSQIIYDNRINPSREGCACCFTRHRTSIVSVIHDASLFVYILEPSTLFQPSNDPHSQARFVHETRTADRLGKSVQCVRSAESIFIFDRRMLAGVSLHFPDASGFAAVEGHSYLFRLRPSIVAWTEARLMNEKQLDPSIYLDKKFARCLRKVHRFSSPQPSAATTRKKNIFTLAAAKKPLRCARHQKSKKPAVKITFQLLDHFRSRRLCCRKEFFELFRSRRA